MNAEWRNRYDCAILAAGKAGSLAYRYFQAGVDVEWKRDRSPVTEADRAAEQTLRTTLLDAFPDDGFLGEEFGDCPGSSGYRWIIDPIDGTRSFVRGLPLWATLVGLEYRGDPILGVVEVPALGDTYRALRGDGAYRNDRPIHVSDIDTLERSHLYYSSLRWFVDAGVTPTFLKLVQRTERQRGYGDFYGFVLVAQGSGELMVEWGCHAWDLCAVAAIIREAGGKLTTWDDTDDIYRHDVIASNGRVHAEALAILAEAAETGRTARR